MIAIGSGLWEDIQWSRDNVPIPGATDSIYWVKESGTYVVFASPSICPETELTSGLGPDFIFEGPAVPAITQEGDSLVASSGPNYQWYLASQLIPDATSQHYIPTESGDYTVQVSDGSGCDVFSSPYSFVLSSLENIAFDKVFQLFPNPAVDVMMLRNLPKGLTKIELVDHSGRVLRQLNDTNAMNRQEDVSDLESGLYFIRLWQGNKMLSRAFIKK